MTAAEKMTETGAGPLVRDRRLDFSLKRPIVGLSVVEARPAVAPGGAEETDIRLEATWAVDQALKAAAVDLVEWMDPPTPTNMAGALVTGSEADCRAACEAFEKAVLAVAREPVRY